MYFGTIVVSGALWHHSGFWCTGSIVVSGAHGQYLQWFMVDSGTIVVSGGAGSIVVSGALAL